jgi:hypothetical protein
MSRVGKEKDKRKVFCFSSPSSVVYVALGRSAMVCMATRVYLDKFACFASLSELSFVIYCFDSWTGMGVKTWKRKERQSFVFCMCDEGRFSFLSYYFMSEILLAKQDGQEETVLHGFHFSLSHPSPFLSPSLPSLSLSFLGGCHWE